jgi:hypothetical protein
MTGSALAASKKAMGRKEEVTSESRAGASLLAGTLAALCFMVLLAPAGAAGDESDAEARREAARVRTGLGLDPGAFEDDGRQRNSYGRPAVEIEGWRRTAGGGRWPADQATYDIWSGLLSKYVNFDNTSRRQKGEAILPMGAVSSKADGYLAVFYPGHDLSLDGIERYRVRGKESVYYELRYSLQPQEILHFHPMVRMLVDASTGRLYRYELAADYLDLGPVPKSIIGGGASAKIASVVLGRRSIGPYLDGARIEGEIFPTDLYYVRPNDWLGGSLPRGGKARLAWVLPFRTALNRNGSPHLIFIDALTGKTLGGVEGKP